MNTHTPAAARGPQLAEARIAAEQSLQVAATHAQVSIGKLRAAERGETELSYSQVLALAALYGRTVDDLVAPAGANA